MGGGGGGRKYQVNLIKEMHKSRKCTRQIWKCTSQGNAPDKFGNAQVKEMHQTNLEMHKLINPVINKN